MRRYFNENPIAPAPVQLSWSHDVELMAIKDPSRREELANKIFRDKLSFREVRELVKKENSDELKASPASTATDLPGVQLSVKRGALNTYSRAEKIQTAVARGFVALDLGFDLWRLVTSKETDAITLTDKPQYTYQGRVERVIDGDTLWAQIDCGFSTVARKKLRLRGIDCPELVTSEGMRAQEFVEKRIPEGALIVLRTHKSDKFDRYLVDIFYIKGSEDPEKILTEGTFLNQELLDQGHAQEWRG